MLRDMKNENVKSFFIIYAGLKNVKLLKPLISATNVLILIGFARLLAVEALLTLDNHPMFYLERELISAVLVFFLVVVSMIEFLMAVCYMSLGRRCGKS